MLEETGTDGLLVARKEKEQERPQCPLQELPFSDLTSARLSLLDFHHLSTAPQNADEVFVLWIIKRQRVKPN